MKQHPTQLIKMLKSLLKRTPSDSDVDVVSKYFEKQNLYPVFYTYNMPREVYAAFRAHMRHFQDKRYDVTFNFKSVDGGLEIDRRGIDIQKHAMLIINYQTVRNWLLSVGWDPRLRNGRLIIIGG